MFDEALLISELIFKASRSSGAGGQHVNKVASKVELSFQVKESLVLNDDQKELLIFNLDTRLTKNKVLQLQCGESRSQHKNKALVIQRFLDIIREGLIVPKERKPTKVPKSVVKKRLSNKKKQSQKKANRKLPDLD
ncbi:aminoacyl-tRNA hydrolase [Flavobacteriales bacterium 34_180_T64]|nr:aminoacyl-tRNA hydrolase [Flavobacteriales bacterium 34_180_T64]